jgi:hypothetical protein
MSDFHQTGVVRAIKDASERSVEGPLGKPNLPNWTRLTSAQRDFFDHLLEVVELDNQPAAIMVFR